MSRRKRRVGDFPLEDDPLWYKDAILYELHVRAFHDSDGDGIGDFRGLVGHLDYLQDLGVTALWLLPFYPSPLRDDGYDIADYSNINPMYGDLGDFKVFLREAHRRGLRVITELVINHTSDQHPWFQRARRAPPGSSERNFYVWNDHTDKYREARIIFKDFEPSNWTWDPVARAYYWHRFFAHQPDLNYDNPEVQKAVFQVLDFWLDLGIDGLRLDAVPYLYERDGTNCENLPETHAFLKKLRQSVDENFESRMLLAEANQWPEDAVAYFGQGDECHMCFHFPVMPRLFMGIRMEDRFPIYDILQQTPAIPENCQWALFLRNHDELTLEMVTDEDRDYMYRVYAQDPQMRINLGIRRRLAALLGNDRAKIELMNGLLFSLPGTPILYYGDEIGMGDNVYLGDRNGVRTPMQWNGERNAGFSQANPQRLYLPVIIDPEYHYGAVNVEAQQNQPHSLLWRTKHYIALRKRYRAFGRGSLDLLYPDNPKVLAFTRRYQDERILVVANLSRFVQSVELDLAGSKGLVPVEMFGRTSLPAIGEQPYLLTLGPHAIYWFLLEPLRVGALAAPVPEYQVPSIKLSGKWENLFSGMAREALEEVLPAYLNACPWYRRQPWTIEEVQLLESIPVEKDAAEAFLNLVRVRFTEADAETYLVPLAFAEGAQAQRLRETKSKAVVARLRRKGKDGDGQAADEALLYDPLLEKEFPRVLLDALVRRRRFKGNPGEVAAFPLPAARDVPGLAEPAPEPVPARGEQSNTSWVFGECCLLKVFRGVEAGPDPELELGRFLTERVPFAHCPQTLGAVEYRRGRDPAITLAVLHRFVANEGNAWQYTLDALGRYFEHALTEQAKVGEASLADRPLLAGSPRSLGELATEEIPSLAQEWIGTYLGSARLLGQRTAEFHLALAAVEDDPNFAPEPFTGLYQRSLYQSMRTQARQAFLLLRRRLKDLPEEVREEARAMLGQEEPVLQRARLILERKLTAQRLRGHGNYQLPKVLYTGKDFVIIGLEGETGRPLSERRLKVSPLRDVASMLRSFHYASVVALRERGLRPEDIPTLLPWVRFWHRWVTVTFWKAYLAAADQAPFLPREHEDRHLLLDFYLLKRVVNELRYELNTNLDRVRIPLLGLMRLLEAR